MQIAAIEALDIHRETSEMHRLYGIEQPKAERMVEAVRSHDGEWSGASAPSRSLREIRTGIKPWRHFERIACCQPEDRQGSRSPGP